MNKNDEPIIIEQTYKASIENVWRAITELDQMKKWYFENIPSFKAEVGFKTEFNVVSGERTFPHIWQVTEVIPNKKIAYGWKYENYPGDSLVEFVLSEENELTKLQLRHNVLESFPDDIPEFKRESGVEGWNYFIKNSLKEYLENIN